MLHVKESYRLFLEGEIISPSLRRLTICELKTRRTINEYAYTFILHSEIIRILKEDLEKELLFFSNRCSDSRFPDHYYLNTTFTNFISGGNFPNAPPLEYFTYFISTAKNNVKGLQGLLVSYDKALLFRCHIKQFSYFDLFDSIDYVKNKQYLENEIVPNIIQNKIRMLKLEGVLGGVK